MAGPLSPPPSTMTPVAAAALLILLSGCELERVGPAAERSPAAEAVAVAAELEALSARIEEHVLAIQAGSDPEALLASGAPLDLEALRSELEATRARRDELEAKLELMEASAVSARD
jgi:hypothetical protein